MSTRKSWAFRVQHILDEIHNIDIHLKGKTKDDLIENITIARAVTKSIEIIGEAANKIPPHIQLDYPEIPWRDIIGMRHKLIHDYDEVDYGVLWITAVQDLPDLAQRIGKTKLQDKS